MPANGRSCGKCDYWSMLPPEGQDPVMGKSGRCCLNPPYFIKESGWEWLEMFADEWCGQFKPNQERKLAKKESKGVYGLFQNVKLTEDEHAKLIDRFGSTDTVHRIDRLSRYISSKGDKYRSHYATILEWAERDAPTQQQGPIY